MSQLIAMFCDMDAFGKWLAPLSRQRLLQDGPRHRGRPGPLPLSALMTLIVCFHARHDRACTHSSTA